MHTENSGTLRGIVIISLPLVLLALAAYLYGYAWPEYKAKTAAAQLLMDPDSAKFRNLVSGQFGKICGEINGKNRFDAYVGFERFAYDPSTDRAQLESSISYGVASIISWESRCGQD